MASREHSAYRCSPSRQGQIERTSKTRKFVSTVKRPTLDECKVTYTDDAKRTVTPPKRDRGRIVRWEGRSYRIPSNIAGATNYRKG